MKYLRTKNGVIYEIIRETETNFELRSSFDKKMGCNCVMIKRVFGSDIEPTYRKADTIEELCDEFVAIYKDENKSARVLETFGDYRQLDEKQLIYNIKNGWHIYGAIWTEWGLKYVAKINSKGKFELL